jgi:hypothetical protein
MIEGNESAGVSSGHQQTTKKPFKQRDCTCRNASGTRIDFCDIGQGASELRDRCVAEAAPAALTGNTESQHASS